MGGGLWLEWSCHKEKGHRALFDPRRESSTVPGPGRSYDALRQGGPVPATLRSILLTLGMSRCLPTTGDYSLSLSLPDAIDVL